MKIITIIPARGGSKSIPKKNLISFMGKPLIAKTILQSIKTPCINRTIVSTDCDETKKVSKNLNAEVVVRPDDIAGDLATTEEALKHVLSNLKKNENYIPDIVVLLQATSPLRKKTDIENAVACFIKQKADSLISGSHFEDFLFWEKDTNNWKPINYNPQNRMRRQDRNPQFVENGSIYVFKPDILYKFNNRIGGKMIVYEMEFWQSWQIDAYEEIELLEFYYKKHLLKD